MKPKIFIGSSVEGLGVAYSVQKNLEHACEPTVWSQGVFSLSKTSIEALVDAVKKYEFAVFCMTPDDVAQIRGNSNPVARDNVIFEFGLFLGALGRDKVFFITPRSSEGMHLPSDLLGLASATYDASRADNNLEAALGPACHQVANQVALLSVKKYSEEMWQRFRDAKKSAFDLVVKRLTEIHGDSKYMGLPFDSMEYWDLSNAADLLSCSKSRMLLTSILSAAVSIDQKGKAATPIEVAKMEKTLSDFESAVARFKESPNE